MTHLKWQHLIKRRYYCVFLTRDLLGDWVITKSWGGLDNATGRVVHVACSSLDEANKLVEKIITVRKQRGYVLCG